MPSVKTQLATAALFSALSFASHAAYWSPHVGIDAKCWGMKPVSENSNFYIWELFPKVDPAFNLYVGTRINGFFSVDFGYEQARQKEKAVVFQGGEVVFFNTEVAGDAARVDLALTAIHLDFTFYWEIFKRTELMFLMGVAQLHPSTHVYHLSDGTWFEYHNNSDPKLSGRFGFALQFNPIPCFGIKGQVLFDQTKRIEYEGFDQDNNYYNLFPYQASTSWSIGVVYSFNNPRRHPHRIGLEMSNEKL